MLRARHPELQLIAVSASDDPAAIRRSLDAGAVCFIGKSIDPDDLAAAVRALLSDAVHLGANGRSSGAAVATVRTNGSAAAASILTRRELEILSLTSSGMSNSQIARHLWVTEQTVKFHLSNIYRKINVRNRTEASRWAAAHGLLDAQTPSQSSA
jgi:DNA-binding NarL/FixJ family response regulator